MKNNLEKVGERIVKIFIITLVSILCLVLIYASIKFTHNYFTMNDEQICHESNSILINGQCHSELNKSVNEQRTIFLMGGIMFPIIAVLLILYLIILIKTKFKEK